MESIGSTELIQILEVFLAARAVEVVANFDVQFSEVFSSLTDGDAAF